jgi:hypothetical protein
MDGSGDRGYDADEDAGDGYYSDRTPLNRPPLPGTPVPTMVHKVKKILTTRNKWRGGKKEGARMMARRSDQEHPEMVAITA